MVLNVMAYCLCPKCNCPRLQIEVVCWEDVQDGKRLGIIDTFNGGISDLPKDIMPMWHCIDCAHEWRQSYDSLTRE
jgi:hypothetical protein